MGPKIISPAFNLVKVQRWQGKRYQGQKCWMAHGGGHKALGIIVDNAGRVLKGHNKFPDNVFFFSGYPVIQSSPPVIVEPRSECCYELIDFDDDVQGPWLSINPVEGQGSFNFEQLHVRGIFDDKLNPIGLRDVEVKDSTKIDDELTIESFFKTKKVPEKGIVHFPSEVLPDEISGSIIESIGVVDPDRAGDLAFMIAEGFQKEKAGYPEGFKIGKIGFHTGVLETEQGKRQVAKIVLYPK